MRNLNQKIKNFKKNVLVWNGDTLTWFPAKKPHFKQRVSLFHSSSVLELRAQISIPQNSRGEQMQEVLKPKVWAHGGVPSTFPEPSTLHFYGREQVL